MIDSINYIIRNEILDFNYLKKLGISIKKFKYRGTKNNYVFNYKSIEFKYYATFRCIIVQTNPHKILKKRDITNNDKHNYIQEVNYIIEKIFQKEISLELRRIDYCVDIKLGDLKKTYLYLYKWHKPKFGYMKIKEIYNTSIYRQSKRGQYNLNIYSRFEKTKNEEDKDILRIELQLKSAKINNNFKKYGIYKDIYNYWSKDSMEEFYFKFLKNFFGDGKNYKIEKAEHIIEKSKYSKVFKVKLKKFLKNLLENDEDTLVKNKIYNSNTIKKYEKMLGDIGINTVLLPKMYQFDELENILDIARDVANKNYFN